jgi:predicted Zn-dependent protease
MMIRGCDTGPFGRKRVINVSRAEEVKLGADAYHEVLSKETVLRSSQPIVETVREVGRRLAKAAEDPELQKLMRIKPMDFQWEFNVVQSKQINAFCLPGGKVVVYTGIIPVCATEAGLATVMGHEIGHALARHGAERISRQQMIAVGQTAVATSLGNMDPNQRAQLIGLLSAGAQVGSLSYDRDQESEADRIGLYLMSRAGYDPAEAPKFWERMIKATGASRSPEFLSTHPDPQRRIKQLLGWQEEIERVYQSSNKQRSRTLPDVSGR